MSEPTPELESATTPLPSSPAAPPPPPTAAQLPPGWYTNPVNAAQQRYWDGATWTEHYAPAAQSAPAQPTVQVINNNTATAIATGYPMGTYRVSAIVIIIAWIATLSTLGYMLPWAIAATRNLRNHASIGLITFFFGWTIIGWIVPLFQSLRAQRPDEM